MNISNLNDGLIPDIHLVGTEIWNCDGFPVTPKMRYDILTEFAALHDEWRKKPHPFGDNLVTEQILYSPMHWPMRLRASPFGGSEPVEVADELNDWLAGYLVEQWGVPWPEGVCLGHLCCLDAVGIAMDFVQEWLIELRIEDIRDWADTSERPPASKATVECSKPDLLCEKAFSTEGGKTFTP